MKTAYYRARVPVWVDEVPDVETWKSEFLKDEAKEVVEAVGAWVFCFQKEQDGSISTKVEEALKGIQEVVERHSYGADAAMLAVAKPSGKQPLKSAEQPNQEEQEDKCMEYGFEYIDYSATGINEFGEKVGFERLKEALEANEWSAAMDDEGDALNLEDPNDIIDDDDVGSFDREEAEMTAELFGMKAALNAEDGEEVSQDIGASPPQQAGQVEDLDRLMGKLMAIKEQGADLPQEQRKRMAAKAVNELMRENPNI